MCVTRHRSGVSLGELWLRAATLLLSHWHVPCLPVTGSAPHGHNSSHEAPLSTVSFNTTDAGLGGDWFVDARRLALLGCRSTCSGRMQLSDSFQVPLACPSQALHHTGTPVLVPSLMPRHRPPSSTAPTLNADARVAAASAAPHTSAWMGEREGVTALLLSWLVRHLRRWIQIHVSSQQPAVAGSAADKVTAVSLACVRWQHGRPTLGASALLECVVVKVPAHSKDHGVSYYLSQDHTSCA